MRTRFLDALDHREPDRLPYHLWISTGLRERLDRHFGGSAWQQAIEVPIAEPWFMLPERQNPVDGTFRDAYGSLWRGGAARHLVAPVLPDPSLAGFVWPDLRPEWEAQAPALRARLSQAPDRFRFSSFGSAIFERAWMLRGFESFLCDLMVVDTFCDLFLERLTQHQQDLTRWLLELDIDAVWFGDDWSGQNGLLISPELWRRRIRPCLARLVDTVHAAGRKVILHSCGNVRALIPDLIELGIDCLQSVQPEAMDPIALKKEFGRELCFWGGAPVQGLPALTPAEIRARVRRLRDEMAPGGGYICSPAKALPEDLPLDQAVAMIEAVADLELK
jgi:uroporphyrinogen decarboxylase